jgi:radical SAM enzyme (TIGR01210 family)
MIREAKQVEWITAGVDGEAGHRLMVILAATGCTFASRTGGCTNCSFPSFFGVGEPVSEESYLTQLEDALTRIPVDASGPIQIDLFVSGSLFNPEEVPEAAQTKLIERTAGVPGEHRILVETRPEYATNDRLARARTAAGEVRLEVAIGLESADDVIREQRICKGFTWESFERAAGRVHAHDIDLLVHLLLKPIDTGEREAIEDLVTSAARVFAIGGRVGLQPCFVAPDTPVERAFDAGSYRPPWLWSVVEVVQRIAAQGSVYVGLSDEGMEPQRSARNCGDCDARVLAALTAFNQSQDSAPLAELSCSCREEWRRYRSPH